MISSQTTCCLLFLSLIVVAQSGQNEKNDLLTFDLETSNEATKSCLAEPKQPLIQLGAETNETSDWAYTKNSMTNDSSTDDLWTLQENASFHYFAGPHHESIRIEKNDRYSKLDDQFEANRPTVFIIHGWMTKYTPGDWMDRLKDLVFFTESSANVFIIDWSAYSNFYIYSKSVAATRPIGLALAHLIQYLVQRRGLSPKRVHLAGHSLGAHISGFVGKQMIAHDMKVARITAMDPAGLMFAGVNLTNRVDRSDADFVLVLHSNMGTRVTSGLGAWERLGHVDVYLNGGAIQPGCISLSNPLTHDQVFADETNRTSTGDRTKFRPRHMIRSYSSGLLNTNRILQYLYCHHARARRFFELFINDHCQPVAYQCNSYEDFLHGHCWSCGEHGERCFLSVYIAEHEAKRMAVLNRDTSKSYFVLSNDRRPLCINHYHFKMKLSLESANTSRTIQVHLYDRELRSLPLEINGSFEPGYSYEFLVVSHSFDAKEIRLVTAKDISSITDTLWSQPFQQIEQLEISYMSHIDANVRKQKSAVFCRKDFENGLNILIQCDRSLNDVFESL